MIAHWLLTGLPLLLVSPLARHPALPGLKTYLAVVAHPGARYAGAEPAQGGRVALTVRAQARGVLLSLLLLPLYIPVLIFATSAIDAA